ncbi:hypothetical protein CHS0354_032724 [Potamilus streckersoni]|uniref:Letm1 RBD domain-containing protein n=1 Tax=Potamilus streckersoni TaxID=2493646 RepID=A0AAE0RRB9_9BIVA|nr:hypothetical protein CHS0354_032724 [Potamilus streckersoni]
MVTSALIVRQACCSLLQKNRCYCSQPKDTLSPPGRLRRYLMDKLMNYVERYEGFLEHKSPKVFRVYKTFTVGVKDLLTDIHRYYNISSEIWRGKELHSFSWKDLELYLMMPQQILKIPFLLVLSAMPGGAFVFPLVYFFPRHMLTSHFWTDSQRQEFNQYYHRHRVSHFSHVLDHMHRQLRYIDSPTDHQKVDTILNKVEHATQPSTEEILQIKPLFESFPFHVERLSIAYVRHLGQCFGFSLRRSRLQQDGLVQLHIDLALLRYGLDNLSDHELQQACFRRGLNPIGLDRAEQILYLTKWTNIVQHLNENSISLLLHCPLLLACSQPSNRELMGKHLFIWRRRRSPQQE